MQKKLIALALASLAGSAFAQSNVTIYGVVDMGQAWVKSSGAVGGVGSANQDTVGRLDSNSSYIGFKGVEDLGNGLKAVFQYETGFDGSNAGGLVGGRDTFIGLAGGFGTVAAGNLTHPLRAMGAKVELTPGAAGFGTMASVTGQVATVGQTGADNRAANAIAYISPSFSGFTGVVAYVNGEMNNKGNAIAGERNTRAYQVAGQYENGPLFAALGYHKAVEAFGVATAEDARIWRAAAAYTFPSNTKLTALYDDTKVDNIIKRKAWSLGVAQGFGKNTVGIEYARSGDVKTPAGEVNNTGVNMWTAVYSYELSKRTTVHARYSKLNNEDAAANNFYLNPITAATATAPANGGVTPTAGSNLSGFMVGVRHSF